MGKHVLPAARIAAIIVPPLLLAGAKTPEPMRQARSVAEAIAGSEHVIVKGQDHNVEPQPPAPLLAAFRLATTQ